mgnify:CR=1 FL=1
MPIDRAIPYCHRRSTFANAPGAGVGRVDVPCIGGDCPLWVPQTAPDSPADSWPRSWDTAGSDVGSDRHLTGLGWCADNLRCPPWQDKAQFHRCDAAHEVEVEANIEWSRCARPFGHEGKHALAVDGDAEPFQWEDNADAE